jgi:hypothetical protein
VANKALIVHGDRERFFLVVDGDTLRVGDDPAHPGGVIRGLRVVRVCCEVEVEGEVDVVRIGGADEASPPREVTPGEVVEVGRARISLGTPPPGARGQDADALAIKPALPAGLSLRLVVIDGADKGQIFNLPAAGTVTIGKGGKDSDIGLDDLYVSRSHCRLTVDAGGVTVTPVEGPHGTLIDGRRIERPEPLRAGSVLRVGNSHLRLEAGVFEDKPGVGGAASGVHRLATSLTPPAAPARSGDPVGPTEGQVLGHYRVGPSLGRGYTGTVFRGTDEKTGQPITLKVLAAEFPASAAELERFSRAIRDAQHVRHPNLATPLGAGKTGPLCWIAREFIEGESAADVVERIAGGGKPSWTRAARVAVHLARLLDDLHRHRQVHGNITPRNVLIRRADHATKLTDLGLGPALMGSRLLAAVREKKWAAELPYLAPEQAEPGAIADELADLYAVGAVGYALATGRPPVTGRSPEEIVDAARHGRVVRPSTVYRKIPTAFEAVIVKLLAKAPEDRYPSPAALLEDLEPLAQIHEIER